MPIATLVSPMRQKRSVPKKTANEMLLGRIAWYALCVLLSILMIFPLLWMITIALKSTNAIHEIPPQIFPREFHFENFILGPEQIHFPQLFVNTVIISVLSTAGNVLSSMLVGYGLSRIRFPGRKFWFYIFVCSIFVPPMVGLIPIMRLVIKLGFYNTWIPLILPAWLA